MFAPPLFGFMSQVFFEFGVKIFQVIE